MNRRQKILYSIKEPLTPITITFTTYAHKNIYFDHHQVMTLTVLLRIEPHKIELRRKRDLVVDIVS